MASSSSQDSLLQNEGHESKHFEWFAWLKHMFDPKSKEDDDVYDRQRKWIHLIFSIAFLGSAIALTVLVANGDWDISRTFTTDFITDKIVPGPGNNKQFIAGTVKIGWFIVVSFFLMGLVHLYILRHYFARDHYAKNYRMRVDAYRDDPAAFWFHFGACMMIIPVACLIGVTNILLHVLLVSLSLAIVFKFHHEVPRIFEAVLNYYFGKDDHLEQKNLEMEHADNPNKSVYKHALGRRSLHSTLEKHSKGSLINYTSISDAVYGGIVTHFVAFFAWALVTTVLMCYYISALRDASSVFDWYTHVSFWVWCTYQFFHFLLAMNFFAQDRRPPRKSNSKRDEALSFLEYLIINYAISAFMLLLAGWIIMAGSH